MRTNPQAGYMQSLLMPLIVVGVLLLGALGFGAWAFTSRQDYKNNSDEKATAAAAVATEQAKQKAAAQYAEEAKNPLKAHIGPSAYGAVNVMYPKTWSAYISERTDNAGQPMNNYYHPDFVPDVSRAENAYALRVQILPKTYDSVVTGFNSSVKAGRVTVAPYKLPKVESVIGSRIEGQLATGKQGIMVVVPLRNLTLQVSTESMSFAKDFNEIILPNLTFSP